MKTLHKISRRFDSLPWWGHVLVFSGLVLAAALVYLSPSELEFPMDDSYIHMIYAKNLVEQGTLMFSQPGEKGVGTSSILWVLLLAGGHAVGISMHLSAKMLGAACLAAVGASLYALLRGFWRPAPALAAALLVMLSGNMLWFSLSGMETMLFVALGMIALLLYRDRRWICLGLALGLLALARPEGVLLGAAIALLEGLRSLPVRRGGALRGLLLCGLVCLLVCGPWFGYLLWRTGHVLPTSALGKQLTSLVAARYVLAQNNAPALLGRLTGLIYIGLWVVYLLEFTLGGFSLPAPRLVVTLVAGEAGYVVSAWAIAGWAVAASLLAAAGRRFIRFDRWRGWLEDPARRPLMALLLWTFLHNLVYALYLPVPGTASRYGALNHLVLWTALVFGLQYFAHRRRLQGALALGVAVLALANTLYWNRVYDANLEHMLEVRIQAAEYLRESLPAGQVCAVSDIGAVRYYSQRAVVDLGALVDPEAGEWFLQGATDRYLLEKRATCLVLPGRSGTTADGWMDIAEILGLTDSDLLEMRPVQVFEIDRQRWLLGYLPTHNYQASVVIYALEWK